MKTEVLMPWRGGGCSWRVAAQLWCHDMWSSLGLNVRIADDGGDIFSRGASLNVAASESDADVFIAADSDIVISGDAITEAIALASTPGLVIPANRGRYLSADGTELVFSGVDPDSVMSAWEFTPSPATPLVGGLNVVSRETLETAGGWPEFRGWGGEDVAFEHVCEIATGSETRRVDASFTHLFHPKSGDYAVADNSRWLDAFLRASTMTEIEVVRSELSTT